MAQNRQPQSAVAARLKQNQQMKTKLLPKPQNAEAGRKKLLLLIFPTITPLARG